MKKLLIVLALVTAGCPKMSDHGDEQMKNLQTGAEYTVALEACFKRAQEEYMNGGHVPTIDNEYHACRDAADAKFGRKH